MALGVDRSPVGFVKRKNNVRTTRTDNRAVIAGIWKEI